MKHFVYVMQNGDVRHVKRGYYSVRELESAIRDEESRRLIAARSKKKQDDVVRVRVQGNEEFVLRSGINRGAVEEKRTVPKSGKLKKLVNRVEPFKIVFMRKRRNAVRQCRKGARD